MDDYTAYNEWANDEGMETYAKEAEENTAIMQMFEENKCDYVPF